MTLLRLPRARLRRALRRDDGQSTSEYVMLLGGVALAVVGGLALLPGPISDVMNEVAGLFSP